MATTIELEEGHGVNGRDRTILSLQGLVKSIARKIRSRLPAGVDVDDLIGYGNVGLVEALDRYDPGRGVPLEAYVRPRIQGSILDALRAIDWVPRSVRRNAELLEATRADFLEKHGREAGPKELARAIGIPFEKMERFERRAHIRTIGSLDAPMGHESETRMGDTVSDDSPNVLEILEGGVDRRWVTDAIRRLPPRERVAVVGYYFEERSLKDIGGELGVSESRACQLRRLGVERLRFKIEAHRGTRAHAPPVPKQSPKPRRSMEVDPPSAPPVRADVATPVREGLEVFPKARAWEAFILAVPAARTPITVDQVCARSEELAALGVDRVHRILQSLAREQAPRLAEEERGFTYTQEGARQRYQYVQANGRVVLMGTPLARMVIEAGLDFDTHYDAVLKNMMRWKSAWEYCALMEVLIDEKSVEQIAYENDEDVVNVRHHYNFGMQRLKRMLQAMVKSR